VDLTLDPARTALVVIDLQKGILAIPSAPHAGPDVVARVVRLAGALKARGGLVVLVHVLRSPDGEDSLHPATDTPPVSGARPAFSDFSEIAPELLPHASVVIGKRQWGAFYGTELDLQLRRRGIGTIVLCGISTTMGVESTARDAYERGFDQVFVEDAMAARDAADHEHTVRTVFPRIGKVRCTEDVLAALG
jgi:nicotinamidase-related amidase